MHYHYNIQRLPRQLRVSQTGKSEPPPATHLAVVSPQLSTTSLLAASLYAVSGL